MREVPGSIPSQRPRHTKDFIKMVPVVPLFSTEHSKGKILALSQELSTLMIPSKQTYKRYCVCFYRQSHGSYGITDLQCTGTESSILECPGTWDPVATSNKSGELAGVTCFTSGNKLFPILNSSCVQFLELSTLQGHQGLI